MKTLFSLLILLAIVAAYLFSVSLYVQGELLVAYLLVLSSLTSFSFWIRSLSASAIK